MFNKKILFLLISSFILLWLDFFHSCELMNFCNFLGIYLGNLEYFLAIYPFYLLFPIIYPLIFENNKLEILSYLLFIWSMNDFLWFLVDFDLWLKYWFFDNVIIYKFCFLNNFCIKIYDWMMGISILLRLSLALKWKLYSMNQELKEKIS